MKLELHSYDIYPKVFLVKKPVEITIKPLGRHVAFSGEYTISVISMAHGVKKIYPERGNLISFRVTTGTDGCLRFSYVFEEESEYRIRIQKEEKQIVDLSVYALAEDMRGRYPFRGDLHMHSTGSDGRQAPEIVVANYRRYGYDFIVMSDHHRYVSSLEAIDAYQDVPHEMNIVFGEEVHLPDNDIHIVNFGGKYSVNALLEDNPQNLEGKRRAVIDNPPPIITKEQYKAEVNALIPELNIPDGIEKFTYASCVWIFNHIRKGEGLGIFAHPYWIVGPYQVPESFCAYMTETHPFDAFEVLGGENYYQMNGLQTIHYYEDLAKGIHYPIVGSTDSHNSIAELNRNALLCSTFVFAKENEREALINAIKEEYSIAVDTISEEYRLVGSKRLAKYTRFLLDDFTPLHDAICAEDGRLMKEYVTGDPYAKADLEYTYGRMQRLYQKYFAIE